MPGSTLVLHALLSVSITLSIHPRASRFPQSSLALSRGFASGVSGDRLPFAWAALRGGSEPIRESQSTAFPQGSAGEKHDVGVQSESEVLGKMLKAMEELVSLDGNSSNFATTRPLWAAFNFSEGHTRVEGEKGRISRDAKEPLISGSTLDSMRKQMGLEDNGDTQDWQVLAERMRFFGARGAADLGEGAGSSPPSAEQIEFWAAVRNANRSRIEELGQSKAVEVDARDERDWTGAGAVHMAASSGELRVLRSLARLGADMEAPDRYGETPMHLAVLFPTLSARGLHGDCVELLVGRLGLAPDPCTFFERTPLHACLAYPGPLSPTGIENLATPQGARDGDGAVDWSSFPSGDAAQQLRVIETLLAHGANASAQDSTGAAWLDQHLLHSLTGGTGSRRVAYVGAPANARTGNGLTPLDWALHASTTHAAAILIEAGGLHTISGEEDLWNSHMLLPSELLDPEKEDGVPAEARVDKRRAGALREALLRAHKSIGVHLSRREGSDEVQGVGLWGDDVCKTDDVLRGWAEIAGVQGPGRQTLGQSQIKGLTEVLASMRVSDGENRDVGHIEKESSGDSGAEIMSKTLDVEAEVNSALCGQSRYAEELWASRAADYEGNAVVAQPDGVEDSDTEIEALKRRIEEAREDLQKGLAAERALRAEIGEE